MTLRELISINSNWKWNTKLRIELTNNLDYYETKTVSKCLYRGESDFEVVIFNNTDVTLSPTPISQNSLALSELIELNCAWSWRTMLEVKIYNSYLPINRAFKMFYQCNDCETINATCKNLYFSYLSNYVVVDFKDNKITLVNCKGEQK